MYHGTLDQSFLLSQSPHQLTKMETEVTPLHTVKVRTVRIYVRGNVVEMAQAFISKSAGLKSSLTS